MKIQEGEKSKTAEDAAVITVEMGRKLYGRTDAEEIRPEAEAGNSEN